MIDRERVLTDLKSISDPRERVVAAHEMFEFLRKLAIDVHDIRVDATSEFRFGNPDQPGNFAALSKELGVHPSTLSKRITANAIRRKPGE